jgi:hypothetical protein
VGPVFQREKLYGSGRSWARRWKRKLLKPLLNEISELPRCGAGKDNDVRRPLKDIPFEELH